MNRVRHILESTSKSESRRVLPALFRGVFVFILFLPMLLTRSLTPSGYPISHALQVMFYTISLVGLILLAGYVTFESAGSRKSGFISLLALTGISPGKWCLVSTCEMWRTLLLIWVVRFPILAWLHTQGNLNWNDVLSLELLYLFLLAWLSAIGLLIGSGKMVKGVTFGVVWGSYVVWEVICNLEFLLNAIAAYCGLQLSPGVDQLTQFLAQFSIYRRVLSLNTGGFDGGEVAMQATVLLCFAVFCSWRFSHSIFSDIGANALGIAGETSAGSPIKKRELPRCWNDALAWQAFYYHQNGMKTILGRTFGYIPFLTAILVMNYYQLSFIEYGSFLFAGVGLVMSPMMAANVALARESKEQTLPSLAMACGDPIQLFQGWQRAWRSLAIPDYFFVPLILAAISWTSADTGFYTATGVIGIGCLGPLFFLAVFLAPWNWRNVITSAKIALGLALIAGVGVLVGWLIDWHLLPILVIPLLYAFSHWMLHRYLPEFFDPLIGLQN